jgi:hypothetical protein
MASGAVISRALSEDFDENKDANIRGLKSWDCGAD